jgi:hypothetical protein
MSLNQRNPNLIKVKKMDRESRGKDQPGEENPAVSTLPGKVARNIGKPGDLFQGAYKSILEIIALEPTPTMPAYKRTLSSIPGPLPITIPDYLTPSFTQTSVSPTPDNALT